MTVKNAIPKFTALLLISCLVALFAMHADHSLLAKMNSMSAKQFVKSQQRMYHHSYLFHFVVWAIIGGFYLATVEFFAYVLAVCFKRKPAD